jgi:hypothetical protein
MAMNEVSETNLRLVIQGVFQTYKFTTERGKMLCLLFYDPETKEPLRYTWVIRGEESTAEYKE